MPDEPGPSHRPAEPAVQPPKRSTRNSMRLSNHDDHLDRLPGDVPEADGVPSQPFAADQAAPARATCNSMRLSSDLTHAEDRADALLHSDGMLTDEAPLPRMTRNSTRLSNPVDSVKDEHGDLSHPGAELDQSNGAEQPPVLRTTRNSMRLTAQPEPTRRLRHHDSQLHGQAHALQSEEVGSARQGMIEARHGCLRHEDPLFPTASRKTRSKLARQLPQQSQPSKFQAALPDSGPESLDAANAAHAEPSCADSPTGQHEGDDVMTRQDPGHDNAPSAELAAHAASNSDAMHEEPGQSGAGAADVSFAASLSGPSAASEHRRRKGKHKPVKGLHSLEPAEKDVRGKQQKRARLNDGTPASLSHQVPCPPGPNTLLRSDSPRAAMAAAGPSDSDSPNCAGGQLPGNQISSEEANAVPAGAQLQDVPMSQASGSEAIEDHAEAVREAACAGPLHDLEGGEGWSYQDAGMQSRHRTDRDPERDPQGAPEPPRKSLKIRLKLRSGTISNAPPAEVNRSVASAPDAAPSELPSEGQLRVSSSQPARESLEDAGSPVDGQQAEQGGGASPKPQRYGKRSSKMAGLPSDAAAQVAAAQAQAEPPVTRSSRRNSKDNGEQTHDLSLHPRAEVARPSTRRNSKDRDQHIELKHEAADQVVLPQPGTDADAEGVRQLDSKAQSKLQKRRSHEGPAALPDGLAIEDILPGSQRRGQRQTRGASHAANLWSASSSPTSPAKQKKEQLPAKPAPRVTRAAARANIQA